MSLDYLPVPENKQEIIDYILQQDDFVSNDTLMKKFRVANGQLKLRMNFKDSHFYKYSVKELTPQDILMFHFDDFDYTDIPIHPEISEEEPQLAIVVFKRIYFISVRNYIKIISGLLEIYLMSNNNIVSLGAASSYLNLSLKKLLDLDDMPDYYKGDIVNIPFLKYVILNSDLFEVITATKHERDENNKIVLKDYYKKTDQDLNLVSSTIRAFTSLKRENLTTSQLAYALSLDPMFTALLKPVNPKELSEALQKFERFKLEGNSISLRGMEEMINNIPPDKYVSFNNIPHFWRGEGLLLLKFIGDKFPMEEAIKYLEIRPIIFASIESEFSAEKLEDLNANFPEFSTILTALLGESDIESWSKENLRAYFIHDQVEHLRTIFDSILKEISPILNIKKNPGNLFAGLIEEKLNSIDKDEE
ncbi:MAG: hypothetical protein LC102_08900 [Ignavibacteriales bacterium]|mgnify:CR=1 FL=1|jgi:hypothetical protein|nr:MAG: hypothetical protein F9K26_05205 [Ignavibacteriaceae bacterium]MBW7872812.1 hypothetical protein [Ignavibacteria bacterium]MCZ2143531.1 hypothetical protein [Ignavibacteriales bacterium]OQY71826.1 MAG: hypothetical protein B6D45_09625 [Ignavibacteriales bacterium UTCHB3]MBV6444408.1 hypothetical protein [Ignavibacteriaceae bacterium]